MIGLGAQIGLTRVMVPTEVGRAELGITDTEES
jgi:hypothetical protein